MDGLDSDVMMWTRFSKVSIVGVGLISVLKTEDVVLFSSRDCTRLSNLTYCVHDGV